jgi:hypothetical protein
MEQVYTYIGMFVVWAVAVFVAANVAYFIFMYARGFVRAVKFTRWAVKNAVKTEITPWIVVKNLFYSWNEQTWFSKSDSYTAGNGSVYRI